MRFLWKTLTYLLWSVFSIIVFLLLVGLAKMKRDVNGYISFLNANDRSVFHRSQPATWADPFWPEQHADIGIEDMLTDKELEDEISGLDVYDPAFENEFATLSTSDSLDEEEDFGFVADETHNSAPQKDSTLQQLIEQRR